MAQIALIACNKRADLYQQDPSFIYRCMNLAHGLRCHGQEVWTGHLAHFPWLQRWDMVMLHRPRKGWRVQMLQSWLRRRGTRVLADVDDLVFDPQFAGFSPGVVNQLVNMDATRKQFASHQAALCGVHAITVSTPPLAQHLQRLMPGTPVAVVPNAVHHTWLDKQLVNAAQESIQTIAYMPGTRSHDRDFYVLAPVLERVLAHHEYARLCVTGPLNFKLKARQEQVIHQPKQSFANYHRCFESVAVNLAPLEKSPFTECKSALKVMEAAWWNIPTICSDFPDAVRFDGAGAYRARHAQDFEDYLEMFLSDSQALGMAKQGLRERVWPQADVIQTSKAWLSFAMQA